MRTLRSLGAVLIGGIATAALVLAILVATGVLGTTDRVVVEKSGTAATGSQSTNQPAAQVTGQMTPTQIYQKYSPGVVEVLSTFPSSGTDFFGQPAGGGQALGSGFVVNGNGVILTNAHVVENNGQKAKSVTVVFKGKGTQTTRVPATIQGIDETSDVAVLKVDPAKVPTLVPIPIGNSDKVQVGEQVVAIGNPLGYDFSLTEGIVSATNRNLQSPNGAVIPNGIQTDAAINEGNSGGPLINAEGQVIGINEQIASQSGGNQGLGFAVPINTAVNVMKQIESTGTVKYAWLGVQGQTITADVAKQLGLKTNEGVLVADVVNGSPADKAGLKGGSGQQTIQGQQYVTGGDLILSINGTRLTGMEQLAAEIQTHKPGDTVTLKVMHGSATKTVKVTLGDRPNNL